MSEIKNYYHDDLMGDDMRDNYDPSEDEYYTVNPAWTEQLKALDTQDSHAESNQIEF